MPRARKRAAGVLSGGGEPDARGASIGAGGRTARRVLRPRAALLCAGARPGAGDQGARVPRAARRRRPTRASPRSRRSAPPTTSRSTTPPTRAQFTPTTSRRTAPSSSSTRPGDLLSADAGGRAAALHPGRRRLRRHRLRAAEVEPGNAFFDGLIGARPAASEPDDAPADAGRRGRRPRAPGDARPAARSGPATTSGTSGTRVRPAPSTPSRATARPARRPATAPTIGGTDTPISWCRDYQGGRSFYTGMGRTAASYGEARLQEAPARRDPVGRRPRARRLQGHDHLQLLGRRGSSAPAPCDLAATRGESHGV